MENITVFRFLVSYDDDEEEGDKMPKYEYTFDARNLSESDIMEHFVDFHTKNIKNLVWYGYSVNYRSQSITVYGISEKDFNTLFGHYHPRVVCLDDTNPLVKVNNHLKLLPGGFI